MSRVRHVLMPALLYIMFPEAAAKNPRDGSLRVCEAVMVPTSLIRGRAWHDLECDARAPGGMAHVVCPWPVQEAASKSHG